MRVAHALTIWEPFTARKRCILPLVVKTLLLTGYYKSEIYHHSVGFIIKKTDKLKTAKSISIHIIGVLTWINQLKSYSCVCWTVGVFRPQPVLMCWRNYVFIRAVWESMGVQVVSCKVWYLFYTSICHPHQHRVMAKLSTYFTVLNPILWQQD